MNNEDTTLYSQPFSDETLNPRRPQTATSHSGHGGKRDISQFVKYLLAGSGIEEDSVDYAALRNELENLDMENPFAESDQAPAMPGHQALNNQSSTLLNQTIDMGSVDIPLAGGDFDDIHIRAAERPEETSGKKQPELSFEEALSDLLNLIDSIRNEGSVQPVSPGRVDRAHIEDWSAEKLNLRLTGAGLSQLPHDYANWSGEKAIVESFCWAFQSALNQCQYTEQKLAGLMASVADIGKKASLLAQLYPKALGYQPNSKMELENLRLRERCHMLEDLVAQTHDRYADLEQRVMSMEEEEEQLRIRAESIIKDVTGHEPTLTRALAGEIREVIAYYEEKIRLLETELNFIREHNLNTVKSQQVETSLPNGHTDGTQTHLAPASHPSSPPKITNSSGSSPQKVKEIYMKEIQELRDELQAVTVAFEEVQEEKEILQLRLSTAKTQEIGGVDVWERKRLPTRELIKRDKEFYRLKLYQVDEMSSDDSKQLIKDVCRKLKIESFRKLVISLDDIAKTVRLVPQLQQFVCMIDAIVWSPPKVLDQFLKIRNQTGSIPETKNPPHKLPDTVDAIKRWRDVMDTELKTLRNFRQTVHQLVLDRDDPSTQSSLNADDINSCLAEIKSLVAHYARRAGASIKRAGKEPMKSTNDVTMQSLDALLGKVNDLERDWERQA